MAQPMGSEKSTQHGDSDLNMAPSDRRNESELFLPNLERQRREQGVMLQHWPGLGLENYLVIKQAKGWDKEQRDLALCKLACHPTQQIHPSFTTQETGSS